MKQERARVRSVTPGAVSHGHTGRSAGAASRGHAGTPGRSLALILFLALAIQATPSQPAIPGKAQLPGEDRNFAGWRSATLLAGGSTSRYGAAIVSPGDLDAALGAQPRRFGLFRSDSAVDGRRELLRGLPFGTILAEAGERNHVDALLLAAVVEAESRFVPHAVSPEGALGLMQLLPSTGRDYGARDLLDPYANVEAGSRYLRVLLDRFKDRSDLAIAAYNTGPEVVARYGCVPPYRETQDFVKRVLSRYAQHRHEVENRPAAATFAGLRGGRSSRRSPAASPLATDRQPSGALGALGR
jgi:hypothetical protein